MSVTSLGMFMVVSFVKGLLIFFNLEKSHCRVEI